MFSLSAFARGLLGTRRTKNSNLVLNYLPTLFLHGHTTMQRPRGCQKRRRAVRHVTLRQVLLLLVLLFQIVTWLVR